MASRIRHPQHVIDEAVQKYLAGESVLVLVKLYQMSATGILDWIKKYKAERLRSYGRASLSPQARANADKHELRMRILRSDMKSRI